jgi:4-hydroxy-tetrahydrodipicolinate synthase
VPEDFVLLSGDDGTYEKFLSLGGHGVISVATHVIPRAKLEVRIEKYLPLIDQLFCEANPIPVKKALQKMKLIDHALCRPPLVEMDASLAQKLTQTMQSLGVL